MDALRSAPSWLTEECPHWCAVLHAEDDHPDDRRHESTSVDVPVISYEKGQVRPEVMSGVLWQRVGQSEAWIALASEDQHIDVTLDSASRIAASLRLLVRWQCAPLPTPY